MKQVRKVKRMKDKDIHSASIEILKKYIIGEFTLLAFTHSHEIYAIRDKIKADSDIKNQRYSFFDEAYKYTCREYCDAITRIMSKMSVYPFKSHAEIELFKQAFLRYSGEKRDFYIGKTKDIGCKAFSKNSDTDKTIETVVEYALINAEAEIEMGIQLIIDKFETKEALI